jgi:hypothetical protein
VASTRNGARFQGAGGKRMDEMQQCPGPQADAR